MIATPFDGRPETRQLPSKKMAIPSKKWHSLTERDIRSVFDLLRRNDDTSAVFYTGSKCTRCEEDPDWRDLGLLSLPLHEVHALRRETRIDEHDTRTAPSTGPPDRCSEDNKGTAGAFQHEKTATHGPYEVLSVRDAQRDRNAIGKT